MTTLRFDFQRECAQAVLDDWPIETVGAGQVILNVGANDDPGHIKALAPNVVYNCDLFEHDAVLDRPNAVDIRFDCVRDRWPFEDGHARLVILGDILEHLKPAEIHACLTEARRVSERLCVTVPCDDRDSTSDQVADRMPRGAVHRTIVTEDLLRGVLSATGWNITDWREVEYDNGAHWGKRVIGYFVQAQ